jgi:hypothetical protein
LGAGVGAGVDFGDFAVGVGAGVGVGEIVVDGTCVGASMVKLAAGEGEPSTAAAMRSAAEGAGNEADALGAQPPTTSATTATNLYSPGCPRSIRSPSTQPGGGSVR